MPRQIRNEESANRRAEGEGEQHRCRNECQHADKIALGRRPNDDKPADGRHQRSADTLKYSGPDERQIARAQRAQQRAYCEDRDRDEKYGAHSKPARNPAARWQQGNEREHVSRNGEAQTNRGHMKRQGHSWQRGCENRRIELSHKCCTCDNECDKPHTVTIIHGPEHISCSN